MTGLSKSQHEVRRPRCPASAVPGFLGFSPYASPLQEWEVHMGIRPFDGDEDLTETGKEMEDGIARGMARDLRWGRMVKSRTLVHPDDWACATPDRLFPQHQRGLQIKNHSPHMARHSYRGKPGEKGEWDNNLVPMQYLIQCLFEMSVVRGALGWKPDRWCLGAYFGGKNRRPYQIRWDPILAKAIWGSAYVFWYWHIREKLAPTESTWHVGSGIARRRTPTFEPDAALHAALPTFSSKGAE